RSLPRPRSHLMALPLALGLLVVATVVRSPAAGASLSPMGAVRAYSPAPAAPRNIILFIGDGMGERQRTAARWVEVGTTGILHMDGLPVGGWSRTASADNAVTDSAAGATAIATGVRTNNGWLAVAPDHSELTTILEHARMEGKSAGLVTTVQVSHATPAAFAAHVEDRNLMDEIAGQMFDEGVEVLLGGGENQFLPSSIAGCFDYGTRTDGRNLIGEALDAGYAHVCTAAELAAVDSTTTSHLLGLLADEEMTRPYNPDLATMTQRAIDVLSRDPQGFFLMVEGGRIDKAAHANNGADAIADTRGLDEAVAVGRVFAASAGNTLVIVTADHETGGMALVPGSDCAAPNGPFDILGGGQFCVTWTTTGHTSADVPVTASGPFSHVLAGSYENTHIFEAMNKALTLDEAVFLPLILGH
ncbi:MAG: alkaline phosphatase, partial [Chloroflexi bacterium]|nr:alkaline phosphatase [Chloroflexota bacterium]